HLAFSPDGTQLAYAAVNANDVRSLWIKNMSDAESHQLSGTNNAINPFWSPDGNHLGFFAEGKLKRLPVSGGAPTVICDAPSGRGGHWATQETIHFAPRFNSEIMRVSASGGEPVPQTAPVAAGSHRWPQLIPGKGLLFTHASQGENLVFQAEGDSASVLVSSATQGNFANGELFYVVANVLFSRPFDPDKGSFVGEPQTIATGVYQSSQYLRAAFSVSNNGAIAYVPGDRDEGFNLVKTGLDGTVLQTQEMGGFASDPNLSPDGTRLAISRSSTTGDDQFNIWVIDLVRDIPTRITKTENVADDPVWAPDGRQLGYANGGNIEVVSASGVGESIQISNSEFDDCLHDWSSDGRYLVWSRATESGMSLVSYDFQTSEERVLVSGDNFVHAQFSPDLRWLAYTSRDSGEPQVYVQDFPELSDRWQISGAGGAYPQWDGNGRMVYLGRDGRLRSVALTGTDTGLDIGQEVVHAECPVGLDRSIRIALDPDGQSLWRIESQDEIEGDPEPIRFILNRRSE
ncbi:MAG: hypothetical protein HKN21_06235, partial [Candidatus Eisenbacteria bacterium]|nr:hypothetical protein [Candidatus Eisenbacteria bacterium]